MPSKPSNQGWDTRIGVIMAVAGAAVGLGNFLRFPGQAAQFGGGAFMIAYFISLIILGLPMAWMEWILGRHGGKNGFNSPAGILNAAWKHPLAKYIGACSVVTLLTLYTYYSYVEAWCLGYAVNFFTGNIDISSIKDAEKFWGSFLGIEEDGTGLQLSLDKIGIFLIIVFIINFSLVYRGISKGIERFAKYAVPLLVVISFIVLIRVLSLGTPIPAHPEYSVNNGLGFMWNPNKVYLQERTSTGWQNKEEIIGPEALRVNEVLTQNNPERYRLNKITMLDQLKRPALWLAAASQLFFSLSVGFGAIMVYASYTKKEDDLALSSLTAVTANEFCEVCLGGLISIPAAFVFLGAAGVVGQSIFALGFKVLPVVFTMMKWGYLFGFLFFFLLFIASISGVLCQLQNGIAFFEEALSLDRKRAVIVVAFMTMLGSTLVFWFSKDIKAMDTFDFWIGQFMIFTLSMINIIIFGWAFGLKKFFAEVHQGAAIKIPKIFGFIIKFLCPAFLLTIFIFWVLIEALGIGGKGIDYHILDLIGSDMHKVSSVAWLAVGNIVILCVLMCLIVSRVKKYKSFHKTN